MAGGDGTRFWPLSRRRTPKQFLTIYGRRSMLQETAHRLSALIPRDRLVVVAGREFIDPIRAQLPMLPAEHLLVEPARRGTAACVALAAEWVARRDPGAVMGVFPADHVITKPNLFRRALATAFATAAKHECLVTFGITPGHPETGYGYVEVGAAIRRTPPRVFRAVRFHEKPTAATAARYVRAGRYLWNSGMFVWRVDVIREAFARFAPRIAAGMRTIAASGNGRWSAATLERVYRRLPNLSVDVAIMERADQVAVVEGKFGWNDVGGWAAMSSLWGTDAAGNARRGNAVVIDSRNTIVYGAGRLVAVVGVEDLVVIDGGDAVLVCRRSGAQDVRRLVDALQRGRHRRLV